MRMRTFVIGYVLALAIFLFAQKPHSGAAKSPSFAAVIDLTRAVDPGAITTAANHGRHSPNAQVIYTNLDAPAQVGTGLWNVGSIPSARLVAPLVILNLSQQFAANPGYQISMQDIADWEKVHGDIPLDSVVMAYTGFSGREYENRHMAHSPGFSLDVAKFLIEARKVVGLGSDSPDFDARSSENSPARQFALAHSVYQLENVTNLAMVPPQGSMVVVAPIKIESGSRAPVRILALLQSPDPSRSTQ
jgi:kynurenine formamidase